MYIDKELQFADGSWAPTATGDNISPNVWDSGPLGGSPTANAGRSLGEGSSKLYLLITVNTTATSGGSATVDFRLRTAAAVALTSSPTDIIGSGAIPVATLVAGYQVLVPVPPSASYKRYIGVNANIGTAVLTAGKFEAEIITDEQLNTKYAGGFSIDV